ncbi:Tetratricopeptide TPR_2 repeat protein [Thermocrinis albus DSM 14484]|uniref:Tetratricopeptide TPR_2 repeat protein n=1 Tax=Thermocrinis albus (strain DSM 14484 / JCM 11386 / HI 11/12) TaxID=638303 RepID=D3SMQ4_THEAH|nr:tetratricopeptide repeat protein [Thermocrinis albus]ADC90034.1 Tetratricopeptide TPR_2 repeat protein [Thermocrinis albus DSM 14484]
MNWRMVYPQTVGLLPYPLDSVVVPYVDRWEEYIEDVLKLHLNHLPPAWSYLESLVSGNFQEALERLTLVEEGPVREYIRCLITGEVKETGDPLLDSLLKGSESLLERGDLDALLLYRKAVKLASSGLVDDALQLYSEAQALVRGISPLFEARLQLERLRLMAEHRGLNYGIIAALEKLFEELQQTGAEQLKAEIHFNLGNFYSSLGDIRRAVFHFSEALTYFTHERNPYMYALINNNMGLTYLSVQATDLEDQMRLAYGIQCLRNALKVFTKEEFPKEWSSVTMNYANALVYLPTANPLKNLLKALELYEEVLRCKESLGDTEGKARVLANMGNALAHLGRFEEAKKRLTEALQLFRQLGLKEEAEGVLELLEEIRTTQVEGHGKHVD